MHAIVTTIASMVRQPLTRLIAGFCIVVLIVFFLFRQLGIWLIAADPLPPRLDIICTFAGDTHRVGYSKELMRRYPDAHWFLSDYRNGHGRLLQKNNFDMRRVTIVDTCKNTISEVTAAKEWLDRYRPTGRAIANGAAAPLLHVGLVSSPYHMRRIKIMAQRRFDGAKVKIHLLPVPLEDYRWSKDSFRYWWRSNVVTSITVLEILKIGYFMLTGYF